MSNGEIVSVLINLAVGLYFAIYYPRSVRKRFAANTTPRAFAFMLRWVPIFGYLIIGMTVIYAVGILTGMVQSPPAG